MRAMRSERGFAIASPSSFNLSETNDDSAWTSNMSTHRTPELVRFQSSEVLNDLDALVESVESEEGLYVDVGGPAVGDNCPPSAWNLEPVDWVDLNHIGQTVGRCWISGNSHLLPDEYC